MGLRIYYEWKDRLERLNRVEIDDNIFNGTPVEVSAGATPFVVEIPMTDLVDNPVIGNGSRLSFIYHGVESFMRDFFTNDIKRHTVTHKINGSINWNGYLNTEVYTEDYSSDGEKIGIEFEMSANNGLAILDRLEFYRDLPNESTVTPLNIITYCLKKTGLVLSKLYYNCDIKLRHPDGTPDVVPDVLTNTLINVSNYINEDGERESCRTALDSALALYRLKLRKIKDNIFIESVNTKARTESITYTVYDLANDVFLSDEVWANSSKLVEGVHWYETGQSLEYDTGINRQVIAVDTYPIEDIIPNELSNKDKLGSLTSIIVHDSSATYQWREFIYGADQHEDFEFIGDARIGANSEAPTCFPTVVRVEDGVDTNIKTEYEERLTGFVKGNYFGVATSSENNFELSWVPTIVNSSLTIDDEYVFKTKSSFPPMRVTERIGSMTLKLNMMVMENIEEYLGSTGDMANDGVIVAAYLKIGSYYLQNELSGSGPDKYICKFSWTTNPKKFLMIYSGDPSTGGTAQFGSWIKPYNYNDVRITSEEEILEEEVSRISDNLSIPSPPSFSSGEAETIEFGVTGTVSGGRFWYDSTDKRIYFDYGPIISGNYLQANALIFEDFALTFEDSVENTKIEFVGEGDEDYKDDGENIDLIVGTSNGVTPLQRGAYMIKMALASDPSQFSIFSPTWYPSANYFEKYGAIINKPENALMETLMANRQTPSVMINGNLKYEHIDEKQLINFSDLPSKNFVFVGGNIDYRDLSISGTWKEIKTD